MRLHEELISIVRVVVHQETTLLRLAAALGPTTNQDGSSSLVMVFNLSPPACLGSRPRSLTRFCCMANLQSLLPSTACLTAILRTTKYSIVGVTSSQETHDDTATTINMLLHKMHCTGCTCMVLQNGARPFSKSYLNS